MLCAELLQYYNAYELHSNIHKTVCLSIHTLLQFILAKMNCELIHTL